MADYREILRLSSQGISQHGSASSCGCSRNTVTKVLDCAQMQGVRWPLKEDVTNGDLQEMLFPGQAPPSLRKRPDYEQVHRDLAESEVTLSLLWHEYCEECRRTGELPLMYTQFRIYYHEFARKTKATMHLNRKPGEQLEVDWAGQTAKITDADTGEEVQARVFVAVLSSNQHAYVEAFLSQHQEFWLAGHVNAFKFFGGVSRILVQPAHRRSEAIVVHS